MVIHVPGFLKQTMNLFRGQALFVNNALSIVKACMLPPRLIIRDVKQSFTTNIHVTPIFKYSHKFRILIFPL